MQGGKSRRWRREEEMCTIERARIEISQKQKTGETVKKIYGWMERARKRKITQGGVKRKW